MKEKNDEFDELLIKSIYSLFKYLFLTNACETANHNYHHISIQRVRDSKH